MKHALFFVALIGFCASIALEAKTPHKPKLGHTEIYNRTTKKTRREKGKLVICENKYFIIQDGFVAKVFDHEGKQVGRFVLSRYESIAEIRKGGLIVTEDEEYFYIKKPRNGKMIYNIPKKDLDVQDIQMTRDGSLIALDNRNVLKVYFPIEKGKPGITEYKVRSIALDDKKNKLYLLKASGAEEWDLTLGKRTKLSINPRGMSTITISGHEQIICS